jgi:hypothetical protein
VSGGLRGHNAVSGGLRDTTTPTLRTVTHAPTRSLRLRRVVIANWILEAWALAKILHYLSNNKFIQIFKQNFPQLIEMMLYTFVYISMLCNISPKIFQIILFNAMTIFLI